jgi:hypothetical protein
MNEKSPLTQFHVSVLNNFLSSKGKAKMGMVVEQPETLEGTGGKYVDKPGLYHAVVIGVDENPASQAGEALNGVMVSVSILAGTNPDQKDKIIDIMMWNPRPDDDDKAKDRARKVQTAFCLATCLIGQFQPGVKTTVEPTEAIGRQVVLKLRHRQKKDEATGKYVDTDRIELSFSDIYHIDHEWAGKNNVPLDANALGLIPASLRKIAKPAPSLADVASSAAPAAAVSGSAAAVDVGDV